MGLPIKEFPREASMVCLFQIKDDSSYVSGLDEYLEFIARMEDPGEEWEREECYASSKVESRTSNLSWLLSQALWLGKKAVMTGVILSSAPLVLPPLVVVSALGFAVSVPAGVALASYACMEKIMKKLLPAPDFSVTMLEEEDDSTERFEVAEKEQGVTSAEPCIKSIKYIEDVEHDEIGPNASVEGKSYEQGGAEYNEEENKGLHERTDPKSENVGEEDKKESPVKETNSPPDVKGDMVVVQEEKKNADATTNPDEPVLLSKAAQGNPETAGEVTANKEVKILEEATTGSLKKNKDDGNSIGPSKKKNKKKSKSCLKIPHGREEHNSVKSIKEAAKPHEVRDEKPKMIDHNDGVKGYTTTTQVENSVPPVEMKSVISESGVREDESTTEGDGKPIRHEGPSINANHAGENQDILNEDVKQQIAKKEVTKEIGMEDGAVSGVDADVDHQRAIHPNSTTSGNTENAGHITGDRTGAEFMTGVPKDPAGDPAGVGFHSAKQGRDECEMSSETTSNEVLPDEKKLWGQVDALRLIVGYKAARRPSLMEELKALYAFTGVEPPSSFDNDDDSDIRGIEDKLHFLMSIVGVK